MKGVLGVLRFLFVSRLLLHCILNCSFSTVVTLATSSLRMYFFVCDRVSCGPGWPGINYIAGSDIELLILLPPSPWHDRCTMPGLVKHVNTISRPVSVTHK